MPVNKHIGKLWFETQEEIDEYDDLMISNIEFKKEDFNSEHFAIMTLRDRREIVPQLTDKARQQVDEYMNFMRNAKIKSNSYTGWWELPIYKHLLGVGASYLVIRELPIRSFYARAFIMAFYLGYLRQVCWPEFLKGGIRTPLRFRYSSEYL